MKNIYHVAPADHSGDLISLYAQHGDDAYEIFASRWDRGAELAQYHAHYVHCYSSLEAAKEHADLHGGKIYEIDAEAMADDFIEIESDIAEFDHPMVRDEVAAEYIKEVA